MFIIDTLDAYIFGGYNGADIFGDVWRLDLDNLAWKKLPNDMAEPAYFHGTTITPVSIYINHLFICSALISSLISEPDMN